MEKEKAAQGLRQEKTEQEILVSAQEVAKRMLIRGLSKEMVRSVMPELNEEEVEELEVNG